MPYFIKRASSIFAAWQSLSAGARDAVILTLSTLVLWFLIAESELCTAVFELAVQNPGAELDSLILAGIISAIGLGVFSNRRWKETQQAVARATDLAFRDELTRLANRRAFLKKLEEACADPKGEPFACLRFDIDRFKQVNDTYGHFVGDQVLMVLARRLENELGPNVHISRLSGDGFAVICPLEGRDLDVHTAKLIVQLVSQPVRVDRKSITVGTSVGVARFPRDADNAHTLLRKTDLALHKSKSDGRGRVRIYDLALDAATQRRSALEEAVRKAIPAGEIVPHYQPLISLADGRITGFEVLARWNSSEFGSVPPSEFIEIISDLGLITQLSAKLMQTACEEAAQWPVPLGISINIAPRQLLAPDFAGQVLSALARSGLEPSRLDLEVTEDALLDNAETVNEVVRKLSAAGVTFALDDFGAGYSSLHNLRTMPFKKIKIDRSFISNVTDCAKARLMVDAIVRLGHSLGTEVLAEGIETSDQAALLRSVGCDMGQGWLYGKALPASQLGIFFAQGAERQSSAA